MNVHEGDVLRYCKRLLRSTPRMPSFEAQVSSVVTSLPHAYHVVSQQKNVMRHKHSAQPRTHHQRSRAQGCCHSAQTGNDKPSALAPPVCASSAGCGTRHHSAPVAQQHKQSHAAHAQKQGKAEERSHGSQWGLPNPLLIGTLSCVGLRKFNMLSSALKKTGLGVKTALAASASHPHPQQQNPAALVSSPASHPWARRHCVSPYMSAPHARAGPWCSS